MQKLAALPLFPSIAVLLFTFIFNGQPQFFVSTLQWSCMFSRWWRGRNLLYDEPVCMIEWVELRLENCRKLGNQKMQQFGLFCCRSFLPYFVMWNLHESIPIIPLLLSCSHVWLERDQNAAWILVYWNLFGVTEACIAEMVSVVLGRKAMNCMHANVFKIALWSPKSPLFHYDPTNWMFSQFGPW